MFFRTLGGCIVAVLLLPGSSFAQVYNEPTPNPAVSAVGHDWYDQRRPILFAGDLYYPAGPTSHFNADTMIVTGSLDGVPLYADSSVEPYSQVLVPVGRGLVQPYERRRAGQLAGTTGSHAPSFPVDVIPGEPDDQQALSAGQPWPGPGPASRRRRASLRDASADEEARQQLLQQPGRIFTVVAPDGNRGIWITYEGQRWTLEGKAVRYDASRFSQIGQYAGFPVYAARGEDAIFIPAVPGMLATYRKK